MKETEKKLSSKFSLTPWKAGHWKMKQLIIQTVVGWLTDWDESSYEAILIKKKPQVTIFRLSKAMA